MTMVELLEEFTLLGSNIPEIEFIYPVNEKRRIYPPYQERRYRRRFYSRKPCWFRIRSNPHRRRKSH